MKIRFNSGRHTFPKWPGITFYLLLSITLMLAMPSTLPAVWQIECADCPHNAKAFVGRTLAIDSSDYIHAIYGGDAIYHAYYDGVTWHIEEIVKPGDVAGTGACASLAIDTYDNVHISYYENEQSRLMYASNASGSWVVETVDDNGTKRGRYNSIVVDSSGFVHISYYDEIGNLMYASNTSGSWHIQTIDTGDAGQFTSIAVDSSDKIHISYLAVMSCDMYSCTYDLKYATNASGTWSIEIVGSSHDSGGSNSGITTSIAIDSSDHVHISNYSSGLKYTTNISGTWVSDTVISGSSGGLYSSISVDSYDKVHISYYDDWSNDLKYANNVGESWTIESVDSSTLIGPYSSIALDSSDNVHIIYSSVTMAPIKHASNMYGSWATEMVDIYIGAVGAYNSIAIDSSDNAHITYHGGLLRYATNLTGSWEQSVIDSSGYNTSLAMDSNDNVHVSYNSGGILKYATNSSGLWGIQNVDSGIISSGDTSIALDSSGNVHICYYDSGDDDLKYATNASGSWVTMIIDSVGNTGGYNSIAIDSFDKVHVSYFNNTAGVLRYATNVSGSWSSETVDSNGLVGRYNSIAVDSFNKVHISYIDYSNRKIKYATNASGVWDAEIIDSAIVYDTSIAIDSLDSVHIIYTTSNYSYKYATNASGSWITEVIASGLSASKYVSIALDSSDKAHIAYYENQPDCNLKYAAQVSDDKDGDGYVNIAYGGTDCDDDDSLVNPGVTEVPYNGKDDDCNTATPDDDIDGDGFPMALDCDDSDPDEYPGQTWYQDSDEDGYGTNTISLQQCERPTGSIVYVLNNLDYDDNNSGVGPPTKIEGSLSYYLSLQEAYNMAGDGEVIQCIDASFNEDLELNMIKSITLSGGFDGAFSDQSGITILEGNMDITNGSLMIENFILQ